MRFFLGAFLGLLLLAGCGRGADPLDWRIEAGDVNDLNAWLNANLPLMPEEVQSELTAAIQNIQSNIPTTGPAGNRVLCRQLDGRSVRGVIITGYELGNSALARRIQTEDDALLGLARTGDVLPQAELDRRVTSRRVRRDALQKVLDKAEARLTALRAELLAQ
jgi:hypothetical protein